MDDEKSESRKRDPGKNVVAGVGLRGKTTTIARRRQKMAGCGRKSKKTVVVDMGSREKTTKKN